MPARTPQSLLRKQLNRQSQRDIIREIRIKNKGGIDIEVVYGIPLDEETRQGRIRLEKELDRSLLNNNLQSLTLEDATKKIKSGSRLRGQRRDSKSIIRECLRSAKNRAKALGVPFDLTADDVMLPEVCPVFGTKLVWSDRITDDTPSLDRFVPEKGYTKDNVAFISYKANRIKNNGTLKDIERVAEWMRSVQNDECRVTKMGTETTTCYGDENHSHLHRINGDRVVFA